MARRRPRRRRLGSPPSELGITIVPTLFVDRLPALADVVARHPDVPVALDHCGFVDVDDAEQMRMLLALAELPSVSLKVSSHVLARGSGERRSGRLVDVPGRRPSAPRACAGDPTIPSTRSLAYGEMLDLADGPSATSTTAHGREFFAATALRLWW